MIEHHNQVIIQFKDMFLDDELIPGSILKEMAEEDFSGLPVVLKIGAVHHKLGMLHRVRKGRDEMFGDLVLEIEGYLEFERLYKEDEDGDATLIAVKPKRFIFKKEI